MVELGSRRLQVHPVEHLDDEIPIEAHHGDRHLNHRLRRLHRVL